MALVLGSPSSEVAAVRALDRPRRVGAVPQLERRVARRHLAPERLKHCGRPVAPLLHALDQQPGQQATRGPLHLRRRGVPVHKSTSESGARRVDGVEKAP